MNKKITFTRSVKENGVVPSCTNAFNSAEQNDEEFSLSKTVKKIADEINRILDHGYSREDVVAILINGNIENIQEAQSNNSISNIAVELLPKSESFAETPHLHGMASYNDSNRLPDHATRWNSR